jgi:hypothetical protein
MSSSEEEAVRPAFRISVAYLMAACSAAHGQFIVDHPPHPFGGPASDTEFIDMSGHPSWQLLADDFQVSAAATARRLVWFGFYDRDNPPTTETMQIRLYDARASDGLPGNVLYESTAVNPTRIATGRIILVGISPREFRYEFDLPIAIELAPATQYWLEIVQLSDLTTAWRWEFSIVDLNGLAFQNGTHPDWEWSGPSQGDLAFRLVVPEPQSLAAAVLTYLPFSRRHWRRKEVR